MSPRKTKSRNLGKYPYFLGYKKPSDVPFNRLAKQLSVHPNQLRGMIRSARANTTIFTALREMGYWDHQIPLWFARPDEPQLRRRAAPAGRRVSAEKRSDAETRSEPATVEEVKNIIGVVQGRSAERPSALSTRSASPAYTYRAVQPVYQPPESPMLREAVQLLRETIHEGMRDDLNRMKSRQTPTRPMTLDKMKAMAEAYRIRQRMEAQNAAQMFFVMNMLQPRRTAEPIDIEELKEIFSKPFREMASQADAGSSDAGWKEMFPAIGQVISNLTPSTGFSEDSLKRFISEIQEKPEKDRADKIKLAKLVAENRYRKNIDLEVIEHRTKRIIEDFWKYINREL